MSNPSPAASPQSQAVSKALNDAVRGFRSEIETLQDPDRKDRLTKVLDYLLAQQTPASTSRSRHGSFDGGLVVHSWMFYRIARSISVGGLLEAVQDLASMYSEPVIPSLENLVSTMSNVNHSSILTVALLHDLNKAITLNGTPYYVPKILTGGQRSENAPWKISEDAKTPMAALAGAVLIDDSAWAQAFVEMEDAISVRDGVVSLAAAEKLSPGILQTLSGDEKFAIAYHDGAYAGRTGLQNKETGLQLVCHFADLVAARWLS